MFARAAAAAGVLLLLQLGAAAAAADDVTPMMSDERVVFQTDHGDIVFGFYPEASWFNC